MSEDKNEAASKSILENHTSVNASAAATPGRSLLNILRGSLLESTTKQPAKKSNELSLNVANLPQQQLVTPQHGGDELDHIKKPPAPRPRDFHKQHLEHKISPSAFVWNASTLTFGGGNGPILSNGQRPERISETGSSMQDSSCKFVSSSGTASSDEVVHLSGCAAKRNPFDVEFAATSQLSTIAPFTPRDDLEQHYHHPRNLNARSYATSRHSGQTNGEPSIKNLRFVALALSIVTAPSCPILFLCWIPAVVLAAIRRRTGHVYIVSIALSALIIVSVVALFIFSYFLFLTMLSLEANPSESSANRYYVLLNADQTTRAATTTPMALYEEDILSSLNLNNEDLVAPSSLDRQEAIIAAGRLERQLLLGRTQSSQRGA